MSNVSSIKGRSLKIKIKLLFQIDINADDFLEPIVCEKCHRKVDNFWNFRQDCINKENEVVSVKRGNLSPYKPRKQLFQTFPSKDNFDLRPENNDLMVSDKFIATGNYCASFCTRKGNTSLLRQHTYEGLSQFNLEKIWEEMCQIPDLVLMLNAVSGKEQIDSSIKLKYVFIYSILMHLRWNELSCVQRLTTVLAIQGGASKKFHNRLYKLGVCLSYSSRDLILKKVGNHYLDQVIDNVRQGSTYRGTGDNWDMKIYRSHLRQHVGNQDLHLFATNLIKNRVNFNFLLGNEPINDIRTVSRSIFSPSIDELKVYSKNAKILIARVAIDHLPHFSFLKKMVPQHIKHRFSKEMSEKSDIISMPIIDANEAEYKDCVKILRTYEEWIKEIFEKSGMNTMIEQPENPDLPPNPQATHGQTGAHNFHPDEDFGSKICFSGDQLTRVRFAGAKDLLAGSHTASDRFEHCSPFKPVMWHTKASFLQLCFQLLYSNDSVDQIGTLKYFREKYNRKNVTPQKVLDCYEGCEELFISAGKAYIVAALMTFFGMENVDDKPTVNTKTNGQSDDEYYNYVFDKFVEKYVLQKCFSGEDDRIRNYSYCMIFNTVLLMQMIDTSKEGDGDRNMINQKMLLSVFKSLNTYSKYAIEMFLSIAQIECLLPKKLSEQFRWGFFVNWRGGMGNNVEEDLAQEISNRISKKIVQKMGSNKSINSISKICKAVSGIKEITENADNIMGLHQEESSKHTTRSSKDDEQKMIKDILSISPFDNIDGRSHKSFTDIQRSPLKYIKILDFHKWLERQRLLLS